MPTDQQLHNATQAAINAREQARELRMQMDRLRADRDDWRAESIKRGRQLTKLRAKVRAFADRI